MTTTTASGTIPADAIPIAAEERGLAAITHLSGLAGYVVPLGGAIVPLVIWFIKRDSAVVSGIAKQALLLNLVVYLLIGGSAILWLTVILIPLVLLFWCALSLVALVLPIVGAIKASDGYYYRYPVVGLPPG